MNWKPPEFTEAEVRDLLSRKPGQPKIVKYPNRSAWDDLNELEIIEADYYGEEGDGYYPVYEKVCITDFAEKYKDELKQIRAKD